MDWMLAAGGPSNTNTPLTMEENHTLKGRQIVEGRERELFLYSLTYTILD